MKKIISLFLSATIVLWAYAQSPPAPTNRYGMKLTENPDGTYSLQKENRYAKLVNFSELPDLLTPYTYIAKRINSKDYRKAVSMEYVYKTTPNNSLRIAVDQVPGSEPGPVMFYVHGGGWARGSFDSSRSLSCYLAQQYGITGVRIEYTLAPQPGASVEVSIQDILDAVEYVKAHAQELHVDASRIGFLGSSAGAHLAACGALKTGAKVFVGNSGIYNLTTAAITTRAKDSERIAYFGGLEEQYLADASPAYLIPKECSIAAQLFCGTGDITVEYSQSQEFASCLKNRRATVDLQIYKNYDHGLNSKQADSMEEIFFKTVDFVVKYL